MSCRFLYILAFVTVAAVPAQAATYTVSPGMSIQGMLDKASPGDTVQVLVGVYHETLRIDKQGVSLIGMPYQGDRPLLLGVGEFDTLDRAVAVQADNVTVAGFAIRSYSVTAVAAEKIAAPAFRDLIVDRPGQWGLRIVACEDALVERCSVGGAAGAGIYAQDAISLRVRQNESYSNGAGIWIVNASQTLLENNSAHNNTVGLIVQRTPDLRGREYGSYCRISNSRFFANNRELDSGDTGFPETVVPGVGILVIAADYTEIMRCDFMENGVYAAMVMGHDRAKGEGQFRSEDESLADPDHTYVHHNTYSGNGEAPSKAFGNVFGSVPPGDLFWDETGERNQFQEDRDLKTVPEQLVTRHGGAHTNVMHFL